MSRVLVGSDPADRVIKIDGNYRDGPGLKTNARV